MIHQPRIYEIFDHNKAVFHERFRDRRSGSAMRGIFTRGDPRCTSCPAAGHLLRQVISVAEAGSPGSSQGVHRR